MDNCINFKFNDPIDLENKIEDLKSKGEVYSVIIEPYSASMLESCSDHFINKLNDLRNKHGFRIIFDEVFTGWYKSKKLFYFQNFKSQIVPDVIALSKSMGGGKSSISCIVVNDDVYDKAYGKLSDTFLHTTTYNGFAEECITALEATSLFATEEFKNKATNLSTYLKKKLLEIKNKHQDKIDEVKGTGILNGIIFKSFYTEVGKIIEKFPITFISNKSFFLKKITATVISCELYEKHNILTAVSDSSNSNHLFVSPSLIINNNEIDLFFEKLDDILTKGASLNSIEMIFNFLKSKIK